MSRTLTVWGGVLLRAVVELKQTLVAIGKLAERQHRYASLRLTTLEVEDRYRRWGLNQNTGGIAKNQMHDKLWISLTSPFPISIFNTINR